MPQGGSKLVVHTVDQKLGKSFFKADYIYFMFESLEGARITVKNAFKPTPQQKSNPIQVDQYQNIYDCYHQK